MAAVRLIKRHCDSCDVLSTIKLNPFNRTYMKKRATRSLFRSPILSVALLATGISLAGCSLAPVEVQTALKEKDKIHKKKTVKIYPDLVKRSIHIKSVEDSPLDFFVFDIHGSMIRYFKMYEGDHEVISGLERGDYVYQVFQDDIMNDSGKIMIK